MFTLCLFFFDIPTTTWLDSRNSFLKKAPKVWTEEIRQRPYAMQRRIMYCKQFSLHRSRIRKQSHSIVV